MDSGEIDPEFIDVFCEKGIFEEQSTLEILKVVFWLISRQGMICVDFTRIFMAVSIFN